MILVPIESPYASSYYRLIVTWPYLALFLRYGDLLAENCVFLLPLCHSSPPLPIVPLGFHGEVKRQETRVTGLISGEGCVLLKPDTHYPFERVVCIGLNFNTRVTDGQTDGRWHIVRYSILCCRALKQTGKIHNKNRKRNLKKNKTDIIIIIIIIIITILFNTTNCQTAVSVTMSAFFFKI